MEISDSSFTFVSDGRGMQIYRLSQGDMVLIIFYSNQCPYCVDAKRVAMNIQGTTRANILFMNIGNYPDFVKRTSKTIYPITEVPYIMLFNNHLPVSRYTGPYDEYQLQSFILRGPEGPNEMKSPSDEIVLKPPTPVCTLETIFQPICENNVCYTPFFNKQS